MEPEKVGKRYKEYKAPIQRASKENLPYPSRRSLNPRSDRLFIWATYLVLRFVSICRYGSTLVFCLLAHRRFLFTSSVGKRTRALCGQDHSSHWRARIYSSHSKVLSSRQSHTNAGRYWSPRSVGKYEFLREHD